MKANLAALMSCAALIAGGCGDPSDRGVEAETQASKVEPPKVEAPVNRDEGESKSEPAVSSTTTTRKTPNAVGTGDVPVSKATATAAKDLEAMGFGPYPGADAKEDSHRTDSSAGSTVGSSWTTTDDIEKVSSYYSNLLRLTAKSGVKRAEADTRTLVGTTKKGSKVTVTIVRPSGANKTEIRLTVTGRPVR